MIKVPYIKVLLKKDMSSTSVHRVPPHEMHVMKIRYGNSITEKEVVDTTREVDPFEEYQRLIRAWGRDNEEGGTQQPWVQVAFGRFEEGRFEDSIMQGAKHYLPKPELTSQQKAAKTRAANKAKLEEEEVHAEDAQSATG